MLDKEHVETIQTLSLSFLLAAAGVWFLVQALGVVFTPSKVEVAHCRLTDFDDDHVNVNP